MSAMSNSDPHHDAPEPWTEHDVASSEHMHQWQPLELDALDGKPTAPQSGGGFQAGMPHTAAPDVGLIRRMAQRARSTFEQETLQQQQAARDEGYAAGEKAGYEAGLARARQEAAEQAARQAEAAQQALEQQAAQLAPLIENLQQSLAGLDEQISDELAALAISVGQHLAREAFRAHPEHIIDSVRSLLAADPPLIGRPRLYLNPDDLPRVEQAMGEQLIRLGWQCLPDASLSLGGCRAEADSGCHDASLESRLDMLSRQLRHRGSADGSLHGKDEASGSRIVQRQSSEHAQPEQARTELAGDRT